MAVSNYGFDPEMTEVTFTGSSLGTSISGTYIRSKGPVTSTMPAGTLILRLKAAHFWISNGMGRWAGIMSHDGFINGYINLGDITSGYVLFEPAGRADVPAPNMALWNSRCPACGKGIYTGLLCVEHEGGPCVTG